MNQGLTFDDVTLVPVFNNIESRTEPDLKTRLTTRMPMQIPIVASNMDTVISTELAAVLLDAGSVPIFHRFADYETRLQWSKDFPVSFVSCGIRPGDIMELEKIIENGEAIGVCFDIAHGHDRRLLKAIEHVRKLYPEIEIIAGNICTSDAYMDLVLAGANAVKVGIGPGAACTTRIVTGFGVPQFTAIQDVAKAKARFKAPIIADGGIRTSADIVKALAAGADVVMLGKLFALTNESAAPKRTQTYMPMMGKLMAGSPFEQVEAKYRGQASADFQEEYFGSTKDGTVPEGESFWAPVSGPAVDVLGKLLAGVRSGMTYGGARSIPELQRKAKFMQVTHNYSAESNPRP
jgi:IMP dehydrogenase